MSDGDALLRAVLQSPDDDAPRLVYADWLDENGQPERAHFIREQCQYRYPGHLQGLLGVGYPPDCVFWKYEGGPVPMWMREDIAEWKGPGGISYHRGFAHLIRCTAADWLQHADHIRERHPVREVRLTTWPEIEFAPIINPPRPGRFFKLAGRALHLFGSETEDSAVVRALLHREWPDITFHLPEREIDPHAFNRAFRTIGARAFR